MGLKSGSRDAGLDDSEDADDQPPEQEVRDVEQDEAEESETVAEPVEKRNRSDGDSEMRPADQSSEPASETEGSGQRPAMTSIPYKLRREKVNEGREQVPYFLREEVIDAEDELQDTLETLLGEDVYKSDYREAAMVVAQRKPELVAEVLREWGYDLDER